MDQYGWLLDPNRCIECRACETACKQWNKVEIGVNVRYRKVRTRETGSFPNVKTQALSISCNHCDNALCIKVCPTKAMYRADGGLVLVNQEACVGCQMCAAFCPYDAPNLNTRLNKTQKCTLCFDRIDAGMQPACVTMCPTGALQWGLWSQVQNRGSNSVEGFSTPATTGPRIRFLSNGYGK